MADTNLPSQSISHPNPPPARPRGLFLPALLIGGGLLALLFNLGLIGWDLAARLTSLWPLLLILLGVQVLLHGSISRRVTSVTGAALLLLVLTWIAAGFASIPGGFESGSGSIAGGHTTAFSGPAGALTDATLELSGGATAISVAGADLGADLYRGSMTLPEGEQPLVALDSATGTLRIETPHRSRFQWSFHQRQRQLNLTLSNRLPWHVHGSVGASQGNLDLGDLRLSGLTLESGASNLRVRVPAPSGTMPVSISGGALNLALTRPAGTPTRVSVDGAASSLTIDGNHYAAFARAGTAFTSNGYEAAADRLDIQVKSGASSVTVTT